MLTKKDKLQLKTLIKDTILLLCKKGLEQKIDGEFNIEGLIGITLAEEELMLVSIHEQVRRSENDESTDVADLEQMNQSDFIPADVATVSKVRPNRKRKFVVYKEDSLDNDEYNSGGTTDDEVITKRKSEHGSGKYAKNVANSNDGEVTVTVKEEPSFEFTIENTYVDDDDNDDEDNGDANDSTTNPSEHGEPSEQSAKKGRRTHSATPILSQMLSNPKKSQIASPTGYESERFKGKTNYSERTKKKLSWGLRLFNEWLSTKRQSESEAGNQDVVPTLDDMSVEQLNHYVPRFLTEVRKADGEDYTFETLKDLILMLQLHLAEKGKYYRLMIEQRFGPISSTLEQIMQIHKMTNRTDLMKVKPVMISPKEENILWEKGVLGTQNPQSLLNALFYTIAVNFGLRSGEDHRALEHGSNSQIKLVTLPSGDEILRYRENPTDEKHSSSKKKRKTLQVRKNLKHPERCPIHIFKTYLSHCPEAIDSREAFYLRPIKNYEYENIWFSHQPLGSHKLSALVKSMCEAAGFTGHRTNHSIKKLNYDELHQRDNESDSDNNC